MMATIWLAEEQIEVWCVGHFTMERKGYYAGTGNVENFQVYDGNDNITDQLSARQAEELEEKYLNYCLMEVCA
jgi:hypothetical protein